MTEAIMISPKNVCRKYTFAFNIINPFLIIVISMQLASKPPMVIFPPFRDVPPITATAKDVIIQSSPINGEAARIFATENTPTNEAITAESTFADIIILSVFIPDIFAVSIEPPVANNFLPKTEYLKNITKKTRTKIIMIKINGINPKISVFAIYENSGGI